MVQEWKSLLSLPEIDFVDPPCMYNRYLLKSPFSLEFLFYLALGKEKNVTFCEIQIYFII